MPNSDVYEVNVNWTVEVQNFTNVLHYRQVGNDGEGDARVALANAFQGQVEGTWTGLVSEDCQLIGYAIRALYPIQTQQWDVARNVPGTDAADAVSPNIAALVAIYSDMDGRKGVGRTFVSGLPELRVKTGQVTDLGRQNLIALGEKFVAPIVDVSSGYAFQLGVWDQVNNVIRDVVKSTVRFRTTNLRSRTMSLVS